MIEKQTTFIAGPAYRTQCTINTGDSSINVCATKESIAEYYKLLNPKPKIVTKEKIGITETDAQANWLLSEFRDGEKQWAKELVDMANDLGAMSLGTPRLDGGIKDIQDYMSRVPDDDAARAKVFGYWNRGIPIRGYPETWKVGDFNQLQFFLEKLKNHVMDIERSIKPTMGSFTQ